jgi:class 3 adenylate cyclase
LPTPPTPVNVIQPRFAVEDRRERADRRRRGDAVTATGLVCSSCGIELPENAKFCLECGAAVSTAAKSAEYKQVTVLFADVVHSMDIAATVGAERLREIMADLADRCAAVVKRYGGTVDKFTGDGIMAMFGAPVALEDHAFRACLAALGIQEETARLAAEVKDRDGIDLWLRVGLNSGQVIAGEIGSGPFGYTAVGEQVGMAQRMESVAPPGGVMLSASTARLVEGAADLSEPELVAIKGADERVPAQRLLGMGAHHRAVSRAESNLVGRRWEMSKFTDGLVDRDGKTTIKSGYLYQLYSYLASQSGRGNPGHDNAEGVLLFVKTENRDVFDKVTIQGHRIRFLSVDLGERPAQIRERWMQCLTPAAPAQSPAAPAG